MHTPANRDRYDEARDERGSGDDVPVEMASWAGAMGAGRRRWLLGEHVAQVGVGFESVGLGTLDERVQTGAGVGAGHGIAEQLVAPPEAEGTDCILDGVGVDAVAPVVTETHECLPLVVQIAHRLAGSVLVLLPALTLIMSGLKTAYFLTSDFGPLRFVAVLVARLYNRHIHGTFPFDDWWSLLPIPTRTTFSRCQTSMSPSMPLRSLPESPCTERDANSPSCCAKRNDRDSRGSGCCIPMNERP